MPGRTCSRSPNTQSSVRAKFQAVETCVASAEAAHARGELAEPQAPQVGQVVEALAGARLALAGETVAEREGHLRHAQPPRADEDLEQDLEAVRAQGVQVERVDPDHEEAAHRIGHLAQAPAEQDARDGARGVRNETPEETELAHAALLAEATGDDRVHVAGERAQDDLLEDLGRVLEVGVHHADPWRVRGTHAGEHRAAEPADALLTLAVDQPHGALRRTGGDQHGVGSAVVGVVHEDDLHREPGRHGLEPGHELADVLLLVAGRDDQRERRGHDVPVAVAVRVRGARPHGHVRGAHQAIRAVSGGDSRASGADVQTRSHVRRGTRGANR